MTESILLSSCGRRVELWDLFRQASDELGLGWRVIGADAAEHPPTAIARGPVFRVPGVRSPGFMDSIATIVERESVRLVVPTIDPEIALYSDGRSTTRVLPVAVSGMPTVAITSDKYETARFAASIGVPAPETRLIESVRGIEDGGWIIKPRFGSSSVGLIVDARSADLDRLRFLGGDTPYVVQRRLRGPEYTVNFYVDRAGRCLEVVPHRRLATRSGEVSHGRTVAHPTLDAYTRKIAERLPGAYGALCAQFIDDAVMGCALIEINARFGGGYPLAHRAGARFPQHLLRDAAGMPADPASLWQPDWEMLRYDQSAFVPPGTT